MLSHHEFATLVLLNGNPSPMELDRADIEALPARELITLERLGPDHSRPHVTTQGYAFLRALGRVPATAGQASQAWQ